MKKIPIMALAAAIFATSEANASDFGYLEDPAYIAAKQRLDDANLAWRRCQVKYEDRTNVRKICHSKFEDVSKALNRLELAEYEWKQRNR